MSSGTVPHSLPSPLLKPSSTSLSKERFCKGRLDRRTPVHRLRGSAAEALLWHSAPSGSLDWAVPAGQALCRRRSATGTPPHWGCMGPRALQAGQQGQQDQAGSPGGMQSCSPPLPATPQALGQWAINPLSSCWFSGQPKERRAWQQSDRSQLLINVPPGAFEHSPALGGAGPPLTPPQLPWSKISQPGKATM